MGRTVQPSANVVSKGTYVSSARALDCKASHAVFRVILQQLEGVYFYLHWPQCNGLMQPGQFICPHASHAFRRKRRRNLLNAAREIAKGTLDLRLFRFLRNGFRSRCTSRVIGVCSEAETDGSFVSLARL